MPKETYKLKEGIVLRCPVKIDVKMSSEHVSLRKKI